MLTLNGVPMNCRPVLLPLVLAGCVPDVTNVYNTYYLEDTTGVDDGEDTTGVEVVPGADGSNEPVCNEMAASEMDDVFDNAANIAFYLDFDAETAEELDETSDMDYDWYVYDLESAESGAPTLDAVWVINLDTEDCVKLVNVEAWLSGESSFDYFTRDDGTFGIPNIAMNIDEEVAGQILPGGYTKVRLNGGGAESGIQREHTALSIARASGFPAPKSTHVLVQTSFWDAEIDSGVWAVYTLVERYKTGFFEREVPEAVQAWEYVGGINEYTVENLSEVDCQWTIDGEDCDNTAFAQSVADLYAVPSGDGWLESASEVWDVRSYWDYKFISYFLGAGDDCERNTNNCVVVQSSNAVAFGPQYLYSVDITADHPWYTGVRYDGMSVMTSMCKRDHACREEELLTGVDTLATIAEVNPAEIASEICLKLVGNGWMRDGDDARCDDVIDFYEPRVEQVAQEFDRLLDRLEDWNTVDTATDTGSIDTASVDTAAYDTGE